MKEWVPASALRWLFDSERAASSRLLPRWIFLRALGLIYYSAFFSLLPQIRGLIGPHGILPAGEYLQALVERFGHAGYWYAPTLFWFSSSAHMLTGICWAGMKKAGHRARACFYWCGNASASILNLAWRRSWAAIRNGGTSRRLTSITRTGRCRHGSGGTCSIGRTGSMRRRRWVRWSWSWGWHG